jgi:hypothetical protein
MVTLSKPGMQRELGMIAGAFQNAIVWAEHEGFDQKMREEFLNTFSNSKVLQNTVSPKL